MKQIYKHLSLALAMIMCSHFVFAQNIVEHTVKRGETLSHIAQKYDTTEEAIREANPQYGDYFYVGMKLTIPITLAAKEEPATMQQENVAVLTSTETQADEQSQNRTNPDTSLDEEAIVEEDKWGIVVDGPSFGFPKGDNVTDFTSGMTFGAKYHLIKNLYASARVGYNSYHASAQGFSLSYHFFAIPVEFGYTMCGKSGKFGIIPMVGLDSNIGLTGKGEIKTGPNKGDYKIKIGGDFAFGAMVGLRFRFGGFNISGTYKFAINDEYKGFFGKSYPEISIGFGF